MHLSVVFLILSYSLTALDYVMYIFFNQKLFIDIKSHHLFSPQEPTYFAPYRPNSSKSLSFYLFFFFSSIIICSFLLSSVFFASTPFGEILSLEILCSSLLPCSLFEILYRYILFYSLFSFPFISSFYSSPFHVLYQVIHVSTLHFSKFLNHYSIFYVTCSEFINLVFLFPNLPSFHPSLFHTFPFRCFVFHPCLFHPFPFLFSSILIHHILFYFNLPFSILSPLAIPSISIH